MYKYSKAQLTNGYPRMVKEFNDCLPEHAKWLLYENQITFHKVPMKERVWKKLNTGVDALQYLGITRRFICERHNISSAELEIFIFLYPFNFFTKRDFKEIATPYYNISMSRLIKEGHIVAFMTKEEVKKPDMKAKDIAAIYTLSKGAKMAVNYFYKVLTGEIKPYWYEKKTYSKDPLKDKLIKGMLEQMAERD